MDALDGLIELLSGRRFLALTGAGCSTESGIPDYRGPGTRRRARNPVQYRAFMDDPAARRRYWARALVGWERFRRARPNPGHRALAALEQDGLLSGVVTQNVDSLHQEAGSRQVVELHGALRAVRCLACGRRSPREELQARLEQANPGWSDLVAEQAPDGDAELPDALVSRFRPLGCARCGGDLKPDVVFFGEGVPRDRVARSLELLEASQALLVVGSSLAVFSGYRFVRAASQRGTPVAIVNLGATRGDPLAQVLVPARSGQALPRLQEALRQAR